MSFSPHFLCLLCLICTTLVHGRLSSGSIRRTDYGVSRSDRSSCITPLRKPTAQIVAVEGITGRPFSPVQSKPGFSQLIKNENYDVRTIHDFSTRDSRMGFIRKVYAIFGTQMVTTIFITYLIMNNPSLASYLFHNYRWISTISFLASTGIILSLVSNKELRYRSPTNFVLLGIHTILQSIMVGTFSSLMNPKAVCLGTTHTLTAFLAITLYSFQPNPKYDLTVFGNGLLAALSSLIVGSILTKLFNIRFMDNIISGGMAVVFAAYLFYDTQKIVGGKHHTKKYGQKEYILAALNLYQDVLNLYLQLVQILDKMERNKRD